MSRYCTIERVFASMFAGQLGQFTPAPDQRGRLNRKVRRPIPQGPQRRKLRWQALDKQLIEPLRRGEILQPVLTQILRPEPLVEELPGGLRDQHLTAMPGRHHPGCVVDIEADVVTLVQPWLTGVYTHPHPHPLALRPLVARKSLLCVGGRGDGLAGGGERDEERIPLGVDFVAAVRPERLLQQPAGGEQQFDVAVARLT